MKVVERLWSWLNTEMDKSGLKHVIGSVYSINV